MASTVESVRNIALGVADKTPVTTLEYAVYLQEIRDAILGAPFKYNGGINTNILLQQIRNALLGVADGPFSNLNSVIYLQQIRNAILGVPDGVFTTLDEGLYWDEILVAAQANGLTFGMVPSQTYLQRVKATTPLAYWTLGDASGTAAVDEMGLGNGTYNSVTLAQPGIGDGKTSVLTSATSYINVYSAALAAAFNPAECTLLIWSKIAAAQWADGASRWMIQLRTDLNNRILIAKDTAANSYRFTYVAGGTTNTLTYTTDGRETFFQIALTISKSAGASGEAKLFFNGSQVGATQTGLGTWVGALNNGRCVIASDNGAAASNSFIGNLAHAAVWSRALTPTEVASISSPFDSSSGLRNLLAIGDSKTDGSGDTAGITPRGYPPILCRLLHDASGLHYSENPPRIGVGGLDNSELEARTAADIAGMTVAPDEILINMGANDLGAGLNIAAWKASYINVITAYHTAFPNANIRLVKVWSRDTGTQAAGMVLQHAAIDEMYASYTWLKPGINEIFLEGGDNGVTYTADGVHPNHAGYELTAAAWKSLILSS